MLRNLVVFVLLVISASFVNVVPVCAEIVHDAEYYILEAQNGERWKAEDGELDKKLADLRKKHGQPPNIIHIMWDDQSFGDCGIPEIQKIRGYETPHINRLAEEGILFTRMYTEAGCTPSRAAVSTGRHAIRSGMYHIGFPVEASGMRDEEVTMAEVLGKAGYATAGSPSIEEVFAVLGGGHAHESAELPYEVTTVVEADIQSNAGNALVAVTQGLTSLLDTKPVDINHRCDVKQCFEATPQLTHGHAGDLRQIFHCDVTPIVLHNVMQHGRNLFVGSEYGSGTMNVAH